MKILELHAVELRGLGKKNKEIAEILEVHEKVVSKWISIFSNQGTQGLMNKPKGGNHRNMTFEQEEEFLKQFEERTKKGELLNTNEIKQEYIKLVGHSIGHEQIYRVLRRHGYRKIMPRIRHPKKASNEEIEQSKKIADLVQKTKIGNPDKTVRLLFEDEASFGRINKPKCCWCSNKFRPCVPCHHIREYRYILGAVEPLTGERFFLVMPNCNTNNMSIF